ncbi:MAG TPA: GNAT family N-acetyltransferase [Bacillales bacterium]|nr:GNAT family N-acetyltransferase [Bacillales bacterium]
MTTEVNWTEITSDNLKNLESVLKLYDQAFPIDVREPHDIFQKGLKYADSSFPNHFRFLVGMEGDTVVSFAIGHYLADVNAGFIVYIVTSPLIRGNGLGSTTLLKMEELFKKDAESAGHSSLRFSILETEMEEQVHTEAEKEDCIKRERFYDKNNYKRYEEINYLQPPLHGDKSGIPLNLLFKSFQESQTITRAEISPIVQAMYREKYYKVNGIDKAVLSNCLKKMGIDNPSF